MFTSTIQIPNFRIKDKLVTNSIIATICVIAQKFTFMMWILNYTV